MRLLLLTTVLYSTTYAGLDDVSSHEKTCQHSQNQNVVQVEGFDTKRPSLKRLSTHLAEQSMIEGMSGVLYRRVIKFVAGMTSPPASLRGGSFFRNSTTKLGTPFLKPWHIFMYQGLNMLILRPYEPPKEKIEGRRFRVKISDINYIPNNMSIEGLSELVRELQKHQDLYRRGCPQISNFAYDLLWRKTVTVHDRISAFATKINSDSWKKEVEDVYSAHELAMHFIKIEGRFGKNEERRYLFHPEINGVDCKLTYENGILTQSVAIINSENVDISNISASSNQIPKSISSTKKMIVEGKLFLQQRDLYNLNISRNKKGIRSWIDTRSAITTAILNSSDPNKELDLKLRFAFISLFHKEGQQAQASTVQSTQKLLRSIGLPTIDKSCYVLGTAAQALVISEKLINQPFECLGVRVKPIEYGQDNSGYIFKQTPDIIKSRVTSIGFRALANGCVVSIVNVTPVRIQNRVVDRIVINNPAEYDALDLRDDDDVELMVTGTMQPFIYSSLYTSKKEKIKYPSSCPKCNAPLKIIKVENDQVSVCPSHLSCRDDSYSHIVHYASAGGANINTLSESVLSELNKKLLVVGAEDLYRLTINDFELLRDIKPDEYRQLLHDIEVSKQITLSRFIYAVNIPSITTFAAEELSYFCGTLDRFLSLNVKDLKDSKSLNEIMKNNLTTYLRNSENIDSIKKLLAAGVEVNGIDPEIANLCGIKDTEYNKKTYDRLSQMINDSNKSYAVTDYEYDQLVKAQQRIERANPKWKRTESLKEDDRKVAWKDPISLQKTYSSTELLAMEQNFGDAEYLIEPKVNGVACSLIYSNGRLARALTKGNGTEALDITAYVRTKANIPDILKKPFSGVVRGELYMTLQNLEKVNEERIQSGYSPYVDGLSLIVGSLKARQNNALVNAFIQFFPFKTISEHNSLYLIEKNINPIVMHQSLTGLGFHNVLSDKMFIKTWKDAVKFAASVNTMRLNYGFDIDGAIIKPIENNDDSTVYALKYNQEIKQSKVESVEFQTLQNKHVVAILKIRPIRFSNGRVVSNVRVFPQNLEMLHINQGVSIKYSGGAVPVFVKAHAIVHAEKNTEVKIPLNCPTCNTLLEKRDNGSLFCSNQRCSTQSLQISILTFASKMQIISHQTDREFLIDLINKGLVRSVSDLYTLVFEDIYQIGSIPLKKIREFESRIKRTQHVPLLSFIKALGINVKFEAERGEINIDKIFGLTVETLIAQKEKPHKAKEIIRKIQEHEQDIKNFTLFAHDNLKVLDSREKDLMQKQDIKSIERSLKSRNISIISALQQCADRIDRVIELNEKDLWWLSLQANEESHKRLLHYLQSAQRLDKKEQQAIRNISNKYVQIVGTMNQSTSQKKSAPVDASFFDCPTDDHVD